MRLATWRTEVAMWVVQSARLAMSLPPCVTGKSLYQKALYKVMKSSRRLCCTVLPLELGEITQQPSRLTFVASIGIRSGSFAFGCGLKLHANQRSRFENR